MAVNTQRAFPVQNGRGPPWPIRKRAIEVGSQPRQAASGPLHLQLWSRRRSRGEAVAGSYRITLLFYTGSPPPCGGLSSCPCSVIQLSEAVQPGGQGQSYPRERKGTAKVSCGGRMVAAAKPAILSPLVQASAPRTVRGSTYLSHVRKTLKPGVPVLPAKPTSFEADGQWLVCRAGASPTEDPCKYGELPTSW